MQREEESDTCTSQIFIEFQSEKKSWIILKCPANTYTRQDAEEEKKKKTQSSPSKRERIEHEKLNNIDRRELSSRHKKKPEKYNEYVGEASWWMAQRGEKEIRYAILP